MTLPAYGSQPRPDYRKIVRADEPRLRKPVPVLNTPVENANHVANKAAIVLNRGGSGLDNPVLAGLGVRLQIGLAAGENLKGVWLFRDHGNQGANLISQVAIAGRVATFDFMAGAGGQTVSGDAGTGARKNFVRWQTDRGAVEKEFWLKDYDRDVVTLNSEAALGEDLEPVEVQVTIEEQGDTWLTVPVDFMTSWADEFHVQHRRSDSDVEAGFKKAYGGALVVSFFDTDPGTEGDGGDVNPINQALIYETRSIQVQNSEGLKEITARFRSKTDSLFYVDVPILIRVLAGGGCCLKPILETCREMVFFGESGGSVSGLVPDETLNQPSEEGVPSTIREDWTGVLGPYTENDLIVLVARGAAREGVTPTMRVIRWVYAADATTGFTTYSGASLIKESTVDLIPLVQDSCSPETEAPYGDPKRYSVAFDVSEYGGAPANVAMYTVQLVDGDCASDPLIVSGSTLRSIPGSYTGAETDNLTGGCPECEE